jgi:hypothetical protein
MRWRCGQQAKIFEDVVESVVFLEVARLVTGPTTLQQNGISQRKGHSDERAKLAEPKICGGESSVIDAQDADRCRRQGLPPYSAT